MTVRLSRRYRRSGCCGMTFFRASDFFNGTRHFCGILTEISREVLRIRNGCLTEAFCLDTGCFLLRLGSRGGEEL